MTTDPADSARPPFAPTGDGPGTPWRRLHPLSPLLRGGLALLVVAGILLANFRDRIFELVFTEELVRVLGPSEGDVIDWIVEQRLLVVAIGVALVVILLIVGAAWLSWRFHTYRITDEAVESRSGVLFRQHRRAPIERIQSVNLQRPLLARLLGLTQVEVQTAGQGGQVTLSYLGFGVAKEVRAQIIGRVAQVRPLLLDVDGDPERLVDPDAVRGPGGLAAEVSDRRSAAIERRALTFAEADLDDLDRGAGSLVAVPTGRLIGSIVLSWDLGFPVILATVSLTVAALWQPIALALLIPAIIIAVGVVARSFNRGYHFTLSRNRDGVRVGSGLTATHTETIPFGRIHAVEARQPVGWRPFGWWRVRVTTAGYATGDAGQNSLRNIVLPVGRVDDVLRVFATLLPDGAASEAAADSLRVALVGRGPVPGFLGAERRAAVLLWFGVRRAGVALSDADGEHATLRVRRGWLTRTLAVLPIVRAQSVEFARPFLHRLLGLGVLQVHTVLGPVRVRMSGLAVPAARGLFDTLAMTTVRVQAGEAHRLRVAREAT